MVEIQGIVAELERFGVPVTVECDHKSWRVLVLSENAGEDIRFNSSRDVALFLNGLLHFASRR